MFETVSMRHFRLCTVLHRVLASIKVKTAIAARVAQSVQ